MDSAAIDRFEASRGRLASLAYRLLGSAADAEDAVQDTFLRWQAANRDRIEVPEAWLTKVVTNLCLDRLRSAQARHERAAGDWLPEPLLEGDPMLGPADTLEQRESVTLAVLTLMERLSPVERAAYVLREAFSYPHAEIAGILDITESASQQHVHRARRRVAAERRGVDEVDLASARRVVEEFLAAATSGRTERLVALLTDDVTAVSTAPDWPGGCCGTRRVSGSLPTCGPASSPRRRSGGWPAARPRCTSRWSTAPRPSSPWSTTGSWAPWRSKSATARSRPCAASPPRTGSRASTRLGSTTNPTRRSSTRGDRRHRNGTTWPARRKGRLSSRRPSCQKPYGQCMPRPSRRPVRPLRLLAPPIVRETCEPDRLTTISGSGVPHERCRPDGAADDTDSRDGVRTTMANLLQDPEFFQNPYPTYAALRSLGPVQPVPAGNGPARYLVTGYAEARAAFTDQRLSKDTARFFAGKDTGRNLHPAVSHSMLATDPPQHTRLRGLVTKAFTPGAIAKLRPYIESVVDEYLDNWTAGERVDAMESLAVPLPVTVICQMLGVPEADRAQVRAWSNDLFAAGQPERIDSASHAVAGYLADLIDARRRTPDDGLLTDLIRARDGQDRLSEDELVSLAVLLLVAGHETTTNLIGNGLLALLRTPELFHQLCEQPHLVGATVDELLRLDSPVSIATFRFATETISIGGAQIPAGSPVLISAGAANRDPGRFAEPDRLDLNRDARVISRSDTASIDVSGLHWHGPKARSRSIGSSHGFPVSASALPTASCDGDARG